MKRPVIGIIVVVAIAAALFFVRQLYHNYVPGEPQSIARKIAALESGEFTPNNPSPDDMSVVLRGETAENLGGGLSAAVCDFGNLKGNLRLAVLRGGIEPVDRFVVHNRVPIKGDKTKEGSDVSGKFSYRYDGKELACEYFGLPFKITRQSILMIPGETTTYHLNERKVVLVGPDNTVIDTFKY